MWMIQAALRRPYTVLVMVVSLAALGALAIFQMRIDIFPTLDIPVIYVAQPFGGMSPKAMEGYLVNYYEENFLYISGVEHIESRSIQNLGLIKIVFHPGTDMQQATAETIAYITRAQAYMPPNTVAPYVLRFDAGSLPVGDLILSSKTRSQAELDDLAATRVRPIFAGLPGVSAPTPVGGNPRSVYLELDEDKLNALHLSPDDVVKTLARGNEIRPGGNLRIGNLNRLVDADTVVRDYRDLMGLPLRTGAGPQPLLRDVASVGLGADVVSGYAELNGRRVVYLPVTKHANASTLAVVREVRQALPLMREQVPGDVELTFAFDQSVYVRNALRVLIIEGLIGALLTGAMVFLFLRDGRSAFFVIVVIPFALLSAVAALWLARQTLNIMTLGGLVLAVGVLVDESTVAIENIHSHLDRGEELGHAVVKACGEIFVPQALAMLCVVAVFLPSLFMTGVSRSLFVPLSIAVGFAMAASFVLSRTLLPVLVARWLHAGRGPGAPESAQPGPKSHREVALWREHLQAIVRKLMARRGLVLGGYFAAAAVLVFVLARADGLDLFPASDSGTFQLHLSAPAGTRLSQTELLYFDALDIIGKAAGPGNIETTLGYVGTHPRHYPLNSVYIWTSGDQDATMQVALNPRAHLSLASFEERLRQDFARRLPQVQLSFESGDIVNQVMNLGSPTPVGVQVTGFDLNKDFLYSEKIRAALARLPELRDLRYDEPYRYPAVLVKIDRERAGQLGLTAAGVGDALTEATASSRFVLRDFWQDPDTGLTYQVQALVPPAAMHDLDDLRRLPLGQIAVDPASGEPAEHPVVLGDLTQPELGTVPGEYDHYNLQRTLTLTANLSHSDLGHAAAHIESVLKRLPPPPRGVRVRLSGQVQPMRETLDRLRTGVILSIVVILLLLTATLQSWRLALVALSSAPAVLVGVLLALRISGTSVNIESSMGAIMAIGVSAANGILLVVMAESRRRHIYRDISGNNDASGDARQLAPGSPPGAAERELRRESARRAALEGVGMRMRPILMTSLAMIGGMIPMALALESGGEQSAPLGRAVIGGLAASTLATLLFMPLVFSWAQRNQSPAPLSLEPPPEPIEETL
jgi:multidrug efflux pump subunit AcrB